MHPTEVLERMVELQKCDGVLDALRREKQTALDAIAALQGKVKGLEDQMVIGKKQQEELAKTRKGFEIEALSKDTQVAKYQAQLLEVKSNEQFQALQHEIEGCKASKAQVEEKILEVFFREDEVKAKIQALAKRIEEDRKVLAEEKKVLEAKVAEFDKALASKGAEREALHTQAEKDMGPDLESYDAIRNGGKKVAVALILESGTCEGCRMEVSPQIQQEVRRRTQLVRCGCGRFLYEAEG